MKIKRRVALAGGLGNQLFQYAHAIPNLEPEEKSSLECIGFKIGKSNALSPDILKFKLARIVVKTDDWKNSKIIQACFNYQLRNSTYDNRLRYFDPILWVVRLILFPAVFIKSFVRSESPRCLNRPRLEVGYFQNKKLDPNVIETMKGISLLRESSELAKYTKLALEEIPLVVHIRIGDYRQDPKLGCLSSNYYKKAISEMLGTGRYGKVWLFSDAIEEAILKMDKNLYPIIRPIEPGIDTAETFEIMRLGAGFIIANSSFSYWAASLRKDQNSEVIAPSPWFKKSHFFNDMLAKDWTIRPAEFD